MNDDSACAESIRDALEASDYSDTERALMLANDIKCPSLVEPIVKLLSVSDEHLKSLAVNALRGYPDHLILVHLMRAAGDESAVVRASALTVLSTLRDEAAHRAVVLGLDDSEFEVRAAAVECIARTGTRDEIRMVIDLAERSRADRVIAAKALSELDSEEAHAFLNAVAQEGDSASIIAAYRHFLRLREVPVALLANALRSEGRVELVYPAAKAFAASGIPELVEAGSAAIASFGHRPAAERDSATDALVQRLRALMRP